MDRANIPLVYTVEEASQILKIGRDLLYRAIREGRLVAKKNGRRTLITRCSLEAYVQNLTDLAPEELVARRPAAKRTVASSESPNAR